MPIRHGSRYRFYYRYESWDAYQSRRPRPRRDLRPLAEKLTALEADFAERIASLVVPGTSLPATS